MSKRRRGASARPDATASNRTSQQPAVGKGGAAAPPRKDFTIGVDSCDSYVKRYRACLGTKVPQASRRAMEKVLLQTAEEWRRAAGRPDGKKGLGRACRTASEAAAASMKALGCTW